MWRIHLGTRQIELNSQQILDQGLLGSVEAIPAHEVGHHVRYPGSLAVDARLRLIERALIPIEDYSLLNLFTDLLINEQLGHDLRGAAGRGSLPLLQRLDGLGTRPGVRLLFSGLRGVVGSASRRPDRPDPRSVRSPPRPSARADPLVMAQHLFTTAGFNLCSAVPLLRVGGEPLPAPSRQSKSGAEWPL